MQDHAALSTQGRIIWF